MRWCTKIDKYETTLTSLSFKSEVGPLTLHRFMSLLFPVALQCGDPRSFCNTRLDGFFIHKILSNCLQVGSGYQRRQRWCLSFLNIWSLAPRGILLLRPKNHFKNTCDGYILHFSPIISSMIFSLSLKTFDQILVLKESVSGSWLWWWYWLL